MSSSAQDQASSTDGSRPDDVGADVKHTLREVAGTIKDEAREAADRAKDSSVDRISGVSRAVHDAAQQLEQEMPQAAGFIHSAAERLEGASSALRERSIEDLASSFGNFARRQPAAAFAGSMLAGFALSRFLKSSAPHR
jgi:hypothetical protein